LVKSQTPLPPQSPGQGVPLQSSVAYPFSHVHFVVSSLHVPTPGPADKKKKKG